MSGEDVSYFTSSKIAAISERKVLKQILLVYRQHRCLWDTRHETYGNKEVRNEAYNILLEKYHLIDPSATVADMRKKIENLRCTYKRQHKRVLLSKLSGWEYKPTLWYYDLLTFLDDLDEPESDEENHLQDEVILLDEPSQINEAQTKKRKLSEDLGQTSSSPHQQEHKDTFSNHEKHIALSDNEAEAFGSAIGLQLRDLEPTQRFIAEKLISEVVFYGRLEKLNPRTCLNNVDENT